MSYLTKSVTMILVTLYHYGCADSFDNGHQVKRYTENITLKQGTLRGLIVEHNRFLRDRLPPVQVFRGIPYAAAPVGELRFLPTGAAPWFGSKVKIADTFGPVCPQMFPDEESMSHLRRKSFLALKQFLMNQSEDCLYLNIYSPHHESGKSKRKYPVMVYIHGESYEWNSGNPYDGSVLAAYGNVIVVTLNFRLGILGFLKTGVEEHSGCNFGLVDQTAALLWVRNNIAAFGGDPASVTLFGHGTGAACANLLMISPMALYEDQMLFHRAILMSGSALSDWALAGNPREVTYQVAQALNCQIHHDFRSCLGRKRPDEILAAGDEITLAYKTRFGPIVDSLVVPNDPKKSMTQYNDIFKRYELLYGVTEMESINLLGSVAIQHGVLEKERDQELRKYIRTRCEMKPELCLARTLAEYSNHEFTQNDKSSEDYTGHEPDKASLARDALLDILSDARSVAPMVQMARFHAFINMESYFYVFTHKTHSKEYIRNKSFNGEELPYVFGVPLGGHKFHFNDTYTEQEKLFSEIIMTYFCNFAHSGNPNVPRRNSFLTAGPAYWSQLDIEWPDFDVEDETYLKLDIPPQPLKHYRNKQVKYWNKVFPEVSTNHSQVLPPPMVPLPTGKPYYRPQGTGSFSAFGRGKPRNPPPPILLFPDLYDNFSKPYVSSSSDVIGTIVKTPPRRPLSTSKPVYGTVLESPPKEVRQSSTMNVVMTIGGLLLFVNFALFIILYVKCYRNRKSARSRNFEVTENSNEPKETKDEPFLTNGCNIVRMISRSTKSDESYENPKSDWLKGKLARQTSDSTIDAHTKVRDWIAQEIVHKYSPRFIGRSGGRKKKVLTRDDLCFSLDLEKNSTLGRSPTRPVSPSDGRYQVQPMKTSTVTRPKVAKPSKVSVAIDATPSGRGPSVLMQKPIELTKSQVNPCVTGSVTALRRSITLEDFSPRMTEEIGRELRKSTTGINLKYSDISPTVIKIDHGHSKLEPVEDGNYVNAKKLRTFNPDVDINVTSRNESDRFPVPLTPEESLMIIKRRNFPKVLPDHPGRETLAHKRRSMPAHGSFLPIPESSSSSQPDFPITKSFTKLPPAPPPRTTTLPKQTSSPFPICVSEPMLAEETPLLEPEIVFNNLYVGPLIPKTNNEYKHKDSQPIYDSLKNNSFTHSIYDGLKGPTTPATVSPSQPIKRADPKVVVRPTLLRKPSDDKQNKNIPRVVVPDNQPIVDSRPSLEKNKPKEGHEVAVENKEENLNNLQSGSLTVPSNNTKTKRSQIPTIIKGSNASLNKESSGSDSTSPSEGSDTGTVVKLQ